MEFTGQAQRYFVDVSETSAVADCATDSVAAAEKRRRLIERLNKIDPETARVQILEQAKPELAKRLRRSRPCSTRSKRGRGAAEFRRAPKKDTAFFFCQNLIKIFAEEAEHLASRGEADVSSNRHPRSLFEVQQRLENGGYSAQTGVTDVRKFANDVRLVASGAVTSPENQCSAKQKLLEARLERFESAMLDLVDDDGDDVEYCNDIDDCSDGESAVTESLAVVPKTAKKQRLSDESIAVQSLPARSESNASNLIPLSYGEKRRLGENICRLPEAKLTELIQLVTTLESPSIVGLEDEIELDIDCMSTVTLRKLEEFVGSFLTEMTCESQ
mmetsp:Transcript_2173/g.5887  ORF Transcript_2173/g.5887 Transcript_2173/m.5887 type:complete len:330 (-) Transcript_2173:879-1868(-)|eukprot:CAMPEP_0185832114 /NCGR_PEP_ID=MMETSP1353-20130828/1895_1 /TAXON_ID=1077150 /ORGANISM="Erythrolobus australicus, Strain CCMP3124" /LENGTH=329 /DNA_ID=CAMNT_0028530255 /DNA_START=491 /DNA_END=1480 /DNA_ORIENTATION=-